MKKVVISLIVLVSMLVALSVTAYAQGEADAFTSEEQKVLTQLMEIREIDGDVSAEVLYDYDDNPEFIMGTTKAGYLIMDRESCAILEWGTGSSPYSKFENDKKYYGGIMCYCIGLKDKDTYFNIVTEEKTKEVSYIENLDKYIASYSESDKDKALDGTKSVPQIIDNYENNLQKLAFGNNTDDTCTSVACGIALNYLDRQYSTLFVADDMESETLTGDDLTIYTQAQAMHQYLKNDCGIGPASFAGDVTDGIEEYRQDTIETSNVEIDADWILCVTVPQAQSYIAAQIDQDKPSMITTTLTSGGDYQWHSMAVYGYNSNTDEILVHTGWASRIDTQNNIINETWIPVSYTTWAYEFNYVIPPLDTSAPTLSSVTPTSPTTMQLEWEAVTGAEYYEIYRYDSYPGPVIETVDSPTLTYEDSGLNPGELYTYKIKACKTNIDDIKIESEFSNIIYARYVLPAPQMSSVTSFSNSITCTWTSVDDATGYELYRTTNPVETYEKIATLTGAETVTYEDDSLSGGTTYYYKVRAYVTVDEEDIYSEFSNVQSATTSIFTYDLNPDNTLTITGYLGSSTDIVIPSAIAGKTVTAIGDDAFSYSDLTSVVIPNSVTIIGAGTFSHTASLTSITIPDSVTSIGEEAFYGSYITSISLSSNLTEISTSMFRGSKLTSIVIPDSVTSIGENAFDTCYDLSNVTLSSNLTLIGSWAFSDTTSLTSIVIPDSVTSIGEGAFSYSYITSISLSSNLTTINASVFNSSNLTSIVIPDSVTSIGEHAFQSCYDLTTVTLSNNTTQIGSWAFVECYSLDNISIPANITYIGSWAFTDCTSLSSVYINPSSAECVIDRSAFSGCTSLSSVTIDTADTLGDFAFLDCSNLIQVELTDVENIGMFAFTGCDSLEEVIITNAAVIGMFAFNECSSLEEVIVTNTEVIGGFAFHECSSLEDVVVSNIDVIDSSAFSDCINMISASINAEEIGYMAFGYCESLEDLSLDGLEIIGDEAFVNCSSLIEVDIPNGTSSIGSCAFLDCSQLEDVSLPSSLISIGSDAFAVCIELEEIVIPNSVTNLGSGAFSDCTGLTRAVIPGSISEISSCAFAWCSSLYDVTLGEGIESIMEYAFADCIALTQITIPNSVTYIDETAFEGSGIDL